MKTGTYIFTKHPNGSRFYPAEADRVTAKFVFFTDDEGQKSRWQNRLANQTGTTTRNQSRVIGLQLNEYGTCSNV